MAGLAMLVLAVAAIVMVLVAEAIFGVNNGEREVEDPGVRENDGVLCSPVI